MYNFWFAVESPDTRRSLEYGIRQAATIEVTWLPTTDKTARPFVNLAQRLRTASPDVLFYESSKKLFPSASVLRQTPTLISLDSAPLRPFSSMETSTKNTTAGKLLHHTRRLLQLEKLDKQSAVIQLAAGYIVWSNWAKNQLIKNYGVAANKIAVVRGGIDLESWDTALARFNANRPENEQLPERVRLLFAGDDFESLGGESLLQILQSDFELAQRYELHLVLTHATAAQLGSSIKRPNVFVHSYSQLRGEGAEHYLNADIFVLPAKQATNPALLATALASGLPVIASRVEGLTELVRDDKNGFLVEPGDVNSLAAAINVLVNDPAKRTALGLASRQLAEQEFNAANNAQRILTFMRQLTAESRQRHSESLPLKLNNFGTMAATSATRHYAQHER